MAKGSVRKKGKKWYYRFYVRDEQGRSVQKEFVGTENKRETERLLRKAMGEYETGKITGISGEITLAALLNLWVEEELKPGTVSNGTLMTYQTVVRRIQRHPISAQKLNRLREEQLQEYLDLLSIGGTNPDGTPVKALSPGYFQIFWSVFQHAFRFAVFPKRILPCNYMQYVTAHRRKEPPQLFTRDSSALPEHITHAQFLELTDLLRRKRNAALLPIQISYYTGLRLGEVCGLTWEDIHLEEQYLTVRRSMRYNSLRRQMEVGLPKRNSARTVDFCDTLAEILRKERESRCQGPLSAGKIRNYYVKTSEKNRFYYDVHSFSEDFSPPQDFQLLSLVCLRSDGSYESPNTIELMCRAVRKQIPGLDNFHFHMLRHTFTTNLLSAGAAPKEVQELLGHADIQTTLNIYAHASRESKRASAKLLDHFF